MDMLFGNDKPVKNEDVVELDDVELDKTKNDNKGALNLFKE